MGKYPQVVHGVFETATALLIVDCMFSPSVTFALVEFHIVIVTSFMDNAFDVNRIPICDAPP